MENNQLIFYTTPQGNLKVEVVFEDESFWLSQKRIASLFDVDVRTGTLPLCIAKKPARARVHGGDEHEIGWKRDR